MQYAVLLTADSDMMFYWCVDTCVELLCNLCTLLMQDLVAATVALEEIKTNAKFSRILELILLIGNYLNTGSRNAQSLGFDISFLSKVKTLPPFQDLQCMWIVTNLDVYEFRDTVGGIPMFLYIC